MSRFSINRPGNADFFCNKCDVNQKWRHPGRSISEDPGSPAVDIVRRCRIGVRHDEIYYVISTD